MGGLVEVVLGELGHVGAFGEVLAEEAVGVLIRTSLPRRVRATEIHLDAGVDWSMIRRPTVPWRNAHATGPWLASSTSPLHAVKLSWIRVALLAIVQAGYLWGIFFAQL